TTPNAPQTSTRAYGLGTWRPLSRHPANAEERPLSSITMRNEASDNPVGAGRRVAIVGAGPAGVYAAAQLLDKGFEVDLIDLLPTPFGLVRAGVAPDHPKIKSVERMYTKTARRDGFRFFGGIELGTDISRAELLEHYNVVVYAIGTSDDNRLGIPGEDRP